MKYETRNPTRALLIILILILSSVQISVNINTTEASPTSIYEDFEDGVANNWHPNTAARWSIATASGHGYVWKADGLGSSGQDPAQYQSVFADGSIEMWAYPKSSNFVAPGLWLRSSGINNNGFTDGYQLWIYKKILYLTRVVDGVRVNVASNTQVINVWPSNKWWHLKFEVVGDELNGWASQSGSHGSTPDITYNIENDSVKHLYGKAGISSRTNMGSYYYGYYDDIRIEIDKLPYSTTENFDDGVAQSWTNQNLARWSFVSGGGTDLDWKADGSGSSSHDPAQYDTPFTDGSIEFTTYLKSSNYIEPGLWLRSSGMNGGGFNNGYQLFLYVKTLYLVRIVDGSRTYVDSTTISEYPVNQWWNMKFEVLGSRLNGWIKPIEHTNFKAIPDVSYDISSDATIHQSGNAGISSRTNMGSSYYGLYDDITIKMYDTHPQSTINFGGNDWIMDANHDLTIDPIVNQDIDYRNTVRFFSKVNDHAQLSRDFNEYSYQTIEVKTSFYKSLTWTGQTANWFPSLLVSYDSGFQVKLSVDENDIQRSFLGPSSGSSSGWFLDVLTDNTWYDLRIKILNFWDMNSYSVIFGYKLSSSSTWNDVRYDLISATLDGPTVILGTPVLEDQGGLTYTSYYFSDFSIQSIDDQDGDGLTDLQEYNHYQGGRLEVDSMIKYDTDDDGLSDSEELTLDISYTKLEIDTSNPISSVSTPVTDNWFGFHSDPKDPDRDHDNLNDGEELLRGSNPNVADTDGDGLNDDEDSEPTLVDTFGPSLQNLHGRPFTVEGEPFTPQEASPGDGVYSFVKVRDHHVYVILDLYDESDLGHVEMKMYHLWPTYTEVIFDIDVIYTNIKSALIEYKSPQSHSDLYDYTVEITAYDKNGYKLKTIKYKIEGIISTITNPITDFIQKGVNWVVDQVEDFVGWVQTELEEAWAITKIWLENKVHAVFNYIQSKLKTIVHPINEVFDKNLNSILAVIKDYDTNPNPVLINSLISNNPYFSEIQPIFGFMETYENEIQWAQRIIDTILLATDTTAIASLAVSAAGDIPGLDMTIFNYFTDLSVTGLVQLIDSAQINIDIQSYLPNGISSSALNSFVIDLPSFINSEIASFITELYNGLALGGSPQLSLNNHIESMDTFILYLVTVGILIDTFDFVGNANSMYDVAQWILAGIGLSDNFLATTINTETTSGKIKSNLLAFHALTANGIAFWMSNEQAKNRNLQTDPVRTAEVLSFFINLLDAWWSTSNIFAVWAGPSH